MSKNFLSSQVQSAITSKMMIEDWVRNVVQVTKNTFDIEWNTTLELIKNKFQQNVIERIKIDIQNILTEDFMTSEGLSMSQNQIKLLQFLNFPSNYIQFLFS